MMGDERFMERMRMRSRESSLSSVLYPGKYRTVPVRQGGGRSELIRAQQEGCRCVLVRAVELTVDFPFGKAERRRPRTTHRLLRRRLALHDFGWALPGYFGAEPDFSQPGLLTPSATPGSTTNLNTRAMEQTQQVRTYEHTLHYPGSEWDGHWWRVA